MTKANLSYVALLASIVLMCIAGCEEGGTNADPNGTLKCVTGEFNDCVMDDGSTGVKRCIDSYWGGLLQLVVQDSGSKHDVQDRVQFRRCEELRC